MVFKCHMAKKLYSHQAEKLDKSFRFITSFKNQHCQGWIDGSEVKNAC